ncbi:MAG: Glu-tRNA(Gln) amidotransferase subunit GatD [Nanoarchaeota archaeon]
MKETIKEGDLIEVLSDLGTTKGILMPSQDPNILILKLDSGYNIAIKKDIIKKIKLLKKFVPKEKQQKPKIEFNKELPTISLLHTGGTIASKVDYRTGAVTTATTPEEILEKFPELKKIANLRSRLVFQMFSEDFEPEHWQILAREIEKELKTSDGVIVTHGTDTMHYTSAALSFMLQDLPKPVILVGSQRSSDRGSSDAFLNLICAARFIANSNYAGVAVCMHKSMSDDYSYIHKGTKVRKLHTSRRDAFKSVNDRPIAEVSMDGKITFLSTDYPKKENKKLQVIDKFDRKLALVKMHPGFNYKELEFYYKNNYSGIVIEGTGLGHIPINTLDKFTKDHKTTLNLVKDISKKIPIVITSQCIFGRINLNVYSTGRDLISAGVISGEDMTPETAYVKLGWLLAQTKDLQKIREMMHKNIAGEITEKTGIEFLE